MKFLKSEAPRIDHHKPFGRLGLAYLLLSNAASVSALVLAFHDRWVQFAFVAMVAVVTAHVGYDEIERFQGDER